MGAWVCYGLGSLTEDLPSFVVQPAMRGLPYNQKGNFSAGFFPSKHQGTIINTGGAQPVPDLFADRKHAFASPEGDAAALQSCPPSRRVWIYPWPGCWMI